MITDTHVHLLPERLALAIRTFLETGLAEVRPEARLAYPLDIQTVLDRLAGEGITMVWNLPYAHRRGVAGPLNRNLANITAEFADHSVEIATGCTVHPDDDHPLADLQEAASAGARVLKLHCSVGAYQPDDVRLAPVLEEAGVLGMPVVVHAGHAVSGFTDGDELSPVGKAAQNHPGTTLILAHFGHDSVPHAIELLDRWPNLMADLTPVLDSNVAVDRAVIEHFSDRLLFGSDAPNTGFAVTELLDVLDQLDLHSETKNAVLHRNASRLVPSLR